MDILSNYEKVNTFESILNTIRLQGYNEKQKEFFYIFLDEFQKHPSLTTIMKNTYDNLKNIKIYASGSSSLAIKNQIQESLAGRKKITEILPLDFEEFLMFKENTEQIFHLKNLHALAGEKLVPVLKGIQTLWEEFLIFGGYPEVVLQKNTDEKKAILESIFDLYVKKDLLDYLKMGKVLNIKKLIEFLAVNHGQKVKYEEASSATSLSFLEIKAHLELLQETYIIEIIRPFYTNK